MGTSGRSDAVVRDVALANTCAALLGESSDPGAPAALASMRRTVTNRIVLKQIGSGARGNRGSKAGSRSTTSSRFHCRPSASTTRGRLEIEAGPARRRRGRRRWGRVSRSAGSWRRRGEVGRAARRTRHGTSPRPSRTSRATCRGDRGGPGRGARTPSRTGSARVRSWPGARLAPTLHRPPGRRARSGAGSSGPSMSPGIDPSTVLPHGRAAGSGSTSEPLRRRVGNAGRFRLWHPAEAGEARSLHGARRSRPRRSGNRSSRSIGRCSTATPGDVRRRSPTSGLAAGSSTTGGCGPCFGGAAGPFPPSARGTRATRPRAGGPSTTACGPSSATRRSSDVRPANASSGRASSRFGSSAPTRRPTSPASDAASVALEDVPAAELLGGAPRRQPGGRRRRAAGSRVTFAARFSRR